MASDDEAIILDDPQPKGPLTEEQKSMVREWWDSLPEDERPLVLTLVIEPVE